ncbi:MAG TPA: hypothetical protein VJ850_05975 [Candidatus Limnocylindrales bacterium]|nr:hypothetical protein [Candidatus Limnocylindrales bacterium]
MDHPVVLAVLAILALVGVIYAVRADSGNRRFRAAVIVASSVAIAYCVIYLKATILSEPDPADTPLPSLLWSIALGVVLGAIITDRSGILPVWDALRRWMPGVSAPPAVKEGIARWRARRAAPRPLPTRWFSVEGDPATLLLTPEDLDAMLAAAVRIAPDSLADDAQVEFRRMHLWGAYQMAVFDAWSDAANRKTEIQVHKTGKVEATNAEGGSRHRPAETPPWRSDNGWLPLIRQVGTVDNYYVKAGDTTSILRANTDPLGPGWSRWHVQLTQMFDPNYFGGLHDGKIERIMNDEYANHPDFRRDDDEYE